MSSTSLQAVLGAHLEAAAEYLQSELAEGAEVPFELERRGGRPGARRPALYCYRPLVGEFLHERADSLERLPTHRQAEIALADFDGLDRYLLDHGVEPGDAGPRGRLREGLLALMEDAFGEGGEFQLAPERLQGALASLQASAGSARSEVTVLARLRGLAIASPELALADGLEIVREEALPGPLPDMGASFAADTGEPVFVLLACDGEDPRRAVHAARGVLAELLRALRLFGDGRIALDALGWVSTGGGAWRALPLPGGPPRGGTLLLTPDQEDELRAFCNLVSGRAFEGGTLEWALRRFELACERAGALEALSDNLLALSALLEDEDSPPGLLPGRLAALCAAHEDVPELAGRIEQAIALERALRLGAAHPGAQGEELAREVAEHLRALLRDVICGHLPERLGELADGIIAEAQQSQPQLPQQPFEGPGAAPQEPGEGEGAGACGEPPDGYTPMSLEEIFSNAAQSEEILDVFI
ncbi:MAG TPA: hypothetical protein VLZ06_00770 [Solirubrobacteraceae bacterium]|nr:hypothetical protein [Solirubrobacteraceae bacterium]